MEGPLKQALSTPRALMSLTLLPLVSLTIPLLVLIISNILQQRPFPPINLSPHLGFPTLNLAAPVAEYTYGTVSSPGRPYTPLLSVYPAALMSSSMGPEPLRNNNNVATAPTQ